MSRLIALFTDFGRRDAYVAQLKGPILTINPEVRLMDLNHEIDPFDISGASYLLEASARFLPADTIFVTVIDPGVGGDRRSLLVQTQANKWYVGPDNGLLTSVLDRQGFQAAYELTNSAYYRDAQVSATFHGRDIFGPVAAHLSLGVQPLQFGAALTDVVTLAGSRPHWAGQMLSGRVRHIDHYGNVISTIRREDLGDLSPGQALTCTVQGKAVAVPFVRTYAEAEPGELVALINSDDAFELAVAQGRADEAIAAEVGASFQVRLGVEV